MLKNLIVLPDGTELYSGTGLKNAIRSASITEKANTGTELTLGSVCSSMLEATIINPGGDLNIAAGDEVTLYKVDDTLLRHKVGLFTLEKPTRPTANTWKVTAYDRVTRLDKDLSEWLAGLSKWPYRMGAFASMVCQQCGLELETEDFPNSDYEVQKFSSRATGRKLMQYIGEAAGRFIRANASGKIEFAWYTPADAQITPSGDHYILQGSLSYEDYETAAIKKVQIQLTDEDVGVVYPDAVGEVNTYRITGNELLANGSAESLRNVAQTIYETVAAAKFMPCSVSIPACLDIRAGNTVQVTDKNGKTFTAYVMCKKQSGQRDQIECTGSYRRDSTTVVNNEEFKNLSGRVFTIKKDVEGLRTHAEDLEGKFSEFEQTAGQVSVKVGSDKGTLTTIIDTNTWQASFVDADGNEKSGIHFDFENGRFVFNGTGQFGGVGDTATFIEIDGEDLVVYDYLGVPVLRIGYEGTPRADSGLSLAFIDFLSRSAFSGANGRIMRFLDGLWVGNSEVSMDAAGGFSPTENSSGIFYATGYHEVQVYNGLAYQNVYTGEAIAKFG